MSGLVNVTRRAFGNAPERRSERTEYLGPNKFKNTYYGNQANEILGQKNGTQKFGKALKAQGVEKQNGRFKRYTGSAQLLGGG